MIVDERPVSTIRPFPNNPRLNDAAVDAVASSIKEFGFRQPIVVDEDGIIVVGHTRYKAALKLGLKTVPVHVARGLTPAQLRAYRLADNQMASLSRWDDELLPLELVDLQSMNFELNLTGFAEDELLRMLDAQPASGPNAPDDVPEPPDEPKTKLGDLWQLGEHRLLCGDSGKPDDFDRLLGPAHVHLAHCDLPTGLTRESPSSNAEPADRIALASPLQPGQSVTRGIASANSTAKKRPARRRRPANDLVVDETPATRLNAWLDNLARVLLPGRAFYLWCSFSTLGSYYSVLREVGLHISQPIIWVKAYPTSVSKDFKSSFECALYGWREGRAHQFYGRHDAEDVWSEMEACPIRTSPWSEKPVALAMRAIEYSSRPGEHVLDPFGGSGSTVIAAEQMGRKAFVMEVNPKHCDVIVTRWERLSGKQAVRTASDR